MNKEFTEGEIVTMYREAKDKKKQVRILTDLCQATEEEILAVLKKYISPKELPRTRKPKEAKEKKDEVLTELQKEIEEAEITAETDGTDYTDDDLDELLTDIDDYTEEDPNPWWKLTDEERDILMDSILVYCDQLKKLIDKTKECLNTCEKKLEVATNLLQDFTENS